MIEDISKKKPSSAKTGGVLKVDHQIMKQENAMGSKLIDSSAAQEGQELKNKIGSKPGQESQQKENRERQRQSETMSQGKAVAADNQMNVFNNNKHEQTIDALSSPKLPPASTTATIPIPSKNNNEANKENNAEMNNSPSMKTLDDNSRSLINSMPKPFKVNNIPNDNSLPDEQQLTSLSESNDSMTPATVATEPDQNHLSCMSSFLCEKKYTQSSRRITREEQR